jgi:AraC-like DNA-binding protein/quercetin dioxygenase-like cupin family protein
LEVVGHLGGGPLGTIISETTILTAAGLPRFGRYASQPHIYNPGVDELPTGQRLSLEEAGDERLLERLLGGVSCTVLSGGWYRFPPDWIMEKRVRPNSIAYVGVGGRAEFVIDQQPYCLTEGTVLLAAPNVPHVARNDPADPSSFYTAHFTASLYGILDAPAVYGLPVAFRPEPGRMGQIVATIRGIVEELDAAAPGSALAANGGCARLLALLWREAVQARGGEHDGPEGQGAAAPGRAEGAARLADLSRLAPVFRVIQDRYGERLTLGQLAELVHLDPAYFSTLFKRVTGLAPLQYVARYRLQQVRHLLLSTDQSIRDIAIATGFRDPFYLSRVFRRVQGMTPSEYRKAKDRPALP